jgi:hypothetical protein
MIVEVEVWANIIAGSYEIFFTRCQQKGRWRKSCYEVLPHHVAAIRHLVFHNAAWVVSSVSLENDYLGIIFERS